MRKRRRVLLPAVFMVTLMSGLVHAKEFVEIEDSYEEYFVEDTYGVAESLFDTDEEDILLAENSATTDEKVETAAGLDDLIEDVDTVLSPVTLPATVTQDEDQIIYAEHMNATEVESGDRERFTEEGTDTEELTDLNEANFAEDIEMAGESSMDDSLEDDEKEFFEKDLAEASGYEDDVVVLSENHLLENETEEDAQLDEQLIGLEEENATEETVAYAVPFSYETGEQLSITAIGSYHNWDGVTNAAQFRDPDGNLCFAVDAGDSVTIYKTSDGTKISGTTILKKQHSLFGTAICDNNWNYYLVTGEKNPTDNTNVETIFISKYDSNGKHLATVGDNGKSSVADYYGDSYATKNPFSAGNCDAAISGNILTVNYARGMYSGHQSNSVFSVDITTMSKVHINSIYESHSFAQRVVPVSDGFVYVSEGDCFGRSFTINSLTMKDGVPINNSEYSIFDFWVEDGAYDKYNMSVVNENFAHMGGLAALSNGNIAFVAQSVKSLNSNAINESEEIFIQIFDPRQPLDSANAYVTSGNRSGLAGRNGRDNVTNYGVKWLTSYGNNYDISNVQVVSTERKQIIVLYELSEGGDYKGVYYISLDESGNVTKPATLLSARAKLNPCEMPVSSDGKISWVGNHYDDPQDQIFLYSLDPAMNAVTVIESVTEKTGLTYSGGSQALVNAGKTSGGNYLYALGEDSDNLPTADQYSTAIPTATKPGTYYVWYKTEGDANHIDGDESCITVSIQKASNPISLKGKTVKIKFSKLKKKEAILAFQKND